MIIAIFISGFLWILRDKVSERSIYWPEGNIKLKKKKNLIVFGIKKSKKKSRLEGVVIKNRIVF